MIFFVFHAFIFLSLFWTYETIIKAFESAYMLIETFMYGLVSIVNFFLIEGFMLFLFIV